MRTHLAKYVSEISIILVLLIDYVSHPIPCLRNLAIWSGKAWPILRRMFALFVVNAVSLPTHTHILGIAKLVNKFNVDEPGKSANWPSIGDSAKRQGPGPK